MAVSLKPPRNRKSIQEDRFDRDTITKFTQANRDIQLLRKAKDSLESSLSSLQTDINNVENTVSAIQSSVTLINSAIVGLDSRLDDLEAKEPLFFYATLSFVGAGTQDRTFNHNLGYVPKRFSVTPFNTALFPDHRVDEVTSSIIRITIGVSAAAAVDVSVIVWPNDP